MHNYLSWAVRIILGQRDDISKQFSAFIDFKFPGCVIFNGYYDCVRPGKGTGILAQFV